MASLIVLGIVVMPLAPIAIQRIGTASIFALNPREAARSRAGLTLEAAAKSARVTPAYLRSIERHGGASFGLAQRLASIYGCRIDLFLTAPAAVTSTRTKSSTKGARA